MIHLLVTEITVQDLIEFIGSVKEIYANLGIFAAIGLPYVETIIPIAPLFLMLAFNILSYGLIFGFIFTYIGTTCATITIFLFLRTFSSKGKLNPKKSKKMERYLNWIENTHPVLHIISMMIPLSPAYLINYSMGLSNVSFGKYLFVTLISRFLMLIFCIPFGMTLIALYEAGEFGGVQVAWLLVFGTIVIAGMVIGQKINHKIEHQESLETS